MPNTGKRYPPLSVTAVATRLGLEAIWLKTSVASGIILGAVVRVNAGLDTIYYERKTHIRKTNNDCIGIWKRYLTLLFQ